jgi:hypothetical protein
VNVWPSSAGPCAPTSAIATTRVVDLQNLSDNRTLLEMADERLREGQAEWKYLTGKPFSAKRDCGTAAR